ncbi:shikimate dehydrogenase [Microlunatus ginsengisoli]|uniref:Shikimate dehydrogenase n=1 Tax=Microlunatus ginsengisoli TaxID=363863 RepID=A0ABP7AEH9_9ACTN
MITGPHRCAVLGSPIEHSLSPELHRAGYAALGLDDWTYDRYEVGEDGLASFVAACSDRTWRGLSLTMPLKLVALQVGRPDDLARLVGAANTLVFDHEAGAHQVTNTDVGGMVNAVRATGCAMLDSATILGGGGTARAALVSLARLGARTVTLVLRTVERAEPLRPLAGALGVDLVVQHWSDSLPTVDLLVSTAVAGAADALAERAAASASVVFDVIYDPWPTALASAAQARGRLVLSGLDLLVHQAVLQFELFTGRRLDPQVMTAALPARSSSDPL